MGIFYVWREGGDKLEQVTRYDYIPLNDIKAKADNNGFIHDTPIITRTGIFTYYEPDGTIRKELRLPEEVFNSDSLASYEGVPLTLNHPKGLVAPDNADKIPIVGTVLSHGIQDKNNVRAKVVIQSQKVVKSGMRGLSAGYTADVIPEVGTYNGEEYTHRQTNIRLNHVAVCKNPRAGAVARLNMDSNEVLEEEKPNEEDKKTMAKIKLDSGLEYEAAPEVIVAFNQLKADNVTLTKDLEGERGKAQTAAVEAKTKLDTVEAERDTLKAEKAKFDEQLKVKDKEHADSIDDAVKQRVSLLSVAAAHKIEKADEMTDRQIKEAVIKTVHGDSTDFSEKSDTYIDGCFDFCKNSSRADSMAEQRKTVNNKKPADQRKDEQEQTSTSRRDAMTERLKNAYKGDKE
jgi:hypothetical protein